MDQILQKIYEIGIIPVIAIDDADKAVPQIGRASCRERV